MCLGNLFYKTLEEEFEKEVTNKKGIYGTL